MTARMIELDGVSKTFGSIRAVDDLSLIVEAGMFVALVGGSGSGKTTSLKLINGLISRDSGQIRVGAVPHDRFGQEGPATSA